MLQAPVSADLNDRAIHTFAVVEKWLFCQPMAELLSAFGEQMPEAGTQWTISSEELANEDLPAWFSAAIDNPRAQIAGLSLTQTDILRRTLAVEQMCADDFDFRDRGDGQYRERAQAARRDFDGELRDQILKLTDQLGLVSPHPTRSMDYDRTLVLGGGYTSPLLRARYAAQLAAAGIRLGEVSFLGSPRFLLIPEDGPAERATTDLYAPGAQDEFDLLIGAAHAEFDLRPTEVTMLCDCPSTGFVCPMWPFADMKDADRTPPEFTHERTVDLLTSTGDFAARALSASTSRPPNRPNTSDTFNLWARVAKPQPGERVLVVTTQVFVPFQTFDALRQLYLPYCLSIETVGFGADWKDRPQTAEYLLQETLSAIRSARRLLFDAAASLRAGQ